MIRLGHINKLRIDRFTDFGAYLIDPEQREETASSPTPMSSMREAVNEVLLPARYVTERMVTGDEVEVFVYTDSEDRPVAVTDRPFAQAGEFAFLQVTDVTRFGAFMDWGLPKDLLVPFKEQNIKMLRGGVYPVYIYVDEASRRVVASARLEKFLGNVYPDFHIGQVVDCLVISHNDRGYKVIVDNTHLGMIYDNELHSPLEIESTVKARVKKVREDGKIDLSLGDRTDARMEELGARIMAELDKNPEGQLPLSDKSSPEEIDRMFKCSKKDFKRSIGLLYKKRLITLDEGKITLIKNK